MRIRKLSSGLLVLVLFYILLSCKQKDSQNQKSIAPENKTELATEKILLPDTIESDQILMHAELLYDSISLVVLENQSLLPVIYNAEYRFEQKTYETWKKVKVRQQDTTSLTLQPGAKDTLKMDLAKDIGYQPLGPCRIYKTIRTINSNQSFELVREADARSKIIDWKKVEIIPVEMELNDTFVRMTAQVDTMYNETYILVTMYNKADKAVTFGDGSSFFLSVFQNNRWYSISYAKVEHNLAIIIPPNDSISKMAHNISYINYAFKPGKYRIAKSFFFENDYKTTYTAGAEFVIP